MGLFISALLVVDTFFASYYMGFHSRTVSVIDPSLPVAVPAPKAVAPAKHEHVKKAPAAASLAKAAGPKTKTAKTAAAKTTAAKASTKKASAPTIKKTTDKIPAAKP